MKTFLARYRDFLFSPISASGFGLMRIAWAATALAFFLMQFGDIATFYSDAGLFPRNIAEVVTRDIYRFTILDHLGQPGSVFTLYLLMLLSFTASMLGIFPRASTIISFVLMCGFHERNPLILGGGDTVLRNVGFLLCIAPTLRAFSLDRLSDQWKHWCKTHAMLPPLTMSAWPYRLLLWQTIVLYVTSVWFKMMGGMWLAGTATTAALQQEVFVRWPRWVMNLFIPLAPVFTYFTMIFESLWVLLLLPGGWLTKIHLDVAPRLKRWLILAGIFFHGGIFVLMDVGSFSVAMFVMFTGLLLNEDFEALRGFLNRRFHGKIHVFYDGWCGLCLRSVFTLQTVDNLRRLDYVDFRDDAARQAHAPDLTQEQLDKAMHVRFPSGRTLHGFDAFRALCWHLPAAWMLAPFLYIPGVPVLGRRIYAEIASKRQKCTHEGCAL